MTEGSKISFYRCGAKVRVLFSETINNFGTESSVSLFSVKGVEHQHPTMCIPSVHGVRSRRRIICHSCGIFYGIDNTLKKSNPLFLINLQYLWGWVPE